MKIESIDKAAATRIRTVLNSALARVEEELDEMGTSANLGHGSYTSSLLTFKLKVGVVGEDGTASTPEGESFKLYAYQFGLAPEDLGREFTNNQGDVCVLTGYKTRARKFPFLYLNKSDGRVYRTTAKAILHYLKGVPA